MPVSGELRSYLVWCLMIIGSLWTALSALVLLNRAWHDWRERKLARVAEIGRILRPLSRRAFYSIIARPATSDTVAAACAAYVMERWGIARVLRDASSHNRLTKWRRVSALLALAHVRHPATHELLAQALEARDNDLAAAAVVGLTRLGDARAAEILVDALRRKLYSASRIATQLERFPTPVTHLLRPLLSDPESYARYWAASILASSGSGASVAADIGALTADPDPSVRKVALEALAEFDDPLVLTVAPRRLTDDAPYVRSAAIRALAARAASLAGNQRGEIIEAIAGRLADEAWEVRQSAKEALVRFGPSAWREVAAQLRSRDAFARNGAAEVLQNIGLLDDMIQSVSRGNAPDPMVQRVLAEAFAEGGPMMIDAALARTGGEQTGRVLQLFDSIGLRPAT